MPAIPEQIRPFVAAVAKYHFWILAAVVPLVLVPMLFSGTTKIDREIQSRSQEIDNRVSALKSVQGIESHPNEGWTEVVETQTKKIQAETVAEWQRFWKDQEPLRLWPKRLGDDFIKAVSGLRPGGVLNRQLLLRYQNTVQELARELPKRMGADDLMAEGAVSGAPMTEGGPGMRGPLGGEFGPRGGPGGEFGGPRPGFGSPAAGGSTALVQWADADQKRVLDSFTFDTPAKRSGKDVISTTQVLLAQEDLWVYGLFCDIIKKLNEGAPDRFESPIGSVSELAVGYPAAEDQPGGQGGGRVMMASAPSGMGGEFGGESMPPPEMAGGMGMPGEAGLGATGRPSNPRFSGGNNPMMGPGGPMGGEFGGDPSAVAPAASPDDQLKEWIYVDFSGKPLTAAELGTLPAAKLVHLVPFRLGVTMDQRKLDALLSELATNPVPIDVRQVRINPSPSSGGGGGGGRPGGGEFPAPTAFPSSEAAAVSGRPYDVFIELRGSVGLAPVPDPKAISGGDAVPAGG